MISKKFIKNKIHYIKETYPNGSINIFVDPEFQKTLFPDPNSFPSLPDLSTISKKLDFIITELNLKSKYSK